MKRLMAVLVLLLSLAFCIRYVYAFAGGTGTFEDPYQISSCIELNDTRYHLYANYTLISDLNCSDTRNWDNGQGFLPIGNLTEYFFWHFNGNRHKITGLYINRNMDYVGLFGIVGRYTNISDLGVEDVNITGNVVVGALVAAPYQNTGYGVVGNIVRCYSTGVVSGNDTVGGLVGYNWIRVWDSYSRARVIGKTYVGGFTGYHSYYGYIARAYSTGNITALPGSSVIGGFYGSSAGSVAQCFFDNQSSGMTSNGGVTEKRTAQMKNVSTFTSAGWNFTSVWSISGSMNDGYPYLRWQNTSAKYPSFTGTSFNAAVDMNNVSNAQLSKSGTTVRWNNSINVAGADFESDMVMDYGFVSMNASKFDSTLNSSANISVQVVGCDYWRIYYADHPVSSLSQLISEGTMVGNKTSGCASYCSNPVCSNGVLTYTVPHFDGTGGSGFANAVPEFSSVTAMIALGVVLAGLFFMRKRAG